ncbi:MAG: UrcA family protein [Sphingomonadaceae bacterium]|nr:UrcA family protein [Sphingomonadaceae bacterium]
MLAPLALIGALAVSAAAAAQPVAVRTEQVPYGDLNLASKEGADRLQLRINAAVRRVCPSQSGNLVETMQCRIDAQKAAKRQMTVAIARAETRPGFQLASK